MYAVPWKSDIRGRYYKCHWMRMPRRDGWYQWYRCVFFVYRRTDIDGYESTVPRYDVESHWICVFKGELLWLSQQYRLPNSEYVLLHNLYISKDGMYSQELYVSSDVDCQWICMSQNRTTDDDCNCNRKLPERSELHVPNWIHFIWKYMYIKYPFILLVSKRRVRHDYNQRRCHDG